MRYIVSGEIVRHVEAEGETIQEAVDRWKELAGSGYPTDWEDTSEDPEACGEIIGGCEACGRPILEGEQYADDEESCLTCQTCLERWAAEAESSGGQGDLTYGGPGPEPRCECGHRAADHDGSDPRVPCRECGCEGFEPEFAEVQHG